MSGVTEGSGASVSASRWGKEEGRMQQSRYHPGRNGKPSPQGEEGRLATPVPYSAYINFVDMYAKFVTDRRQWDGENVGEGPRYEVHGGDRRICSGETVLVAEV